MRPNARRIGLMQFNYQLLDRFILHFQPGDVQYVAQLVSFYLDRKLAFVAVHSSSPNSRSFCYAVGCLPSGAFCNHRPLKITERLFTIDGISKTAGDPFGRLLTIASEFIPPKRFICLPQPRSGMVLDEFVHVPAAPLFDYMALSASDQLE